MDTIFESMDESERIAVFTQMNQPELQQIYNDLDQLRLSWESKEHFLYCYYSRLITNKHQKMQFLLNQLLADYLIYDYISLESVMISLLKQHTFDQSVLEEIGIVFKGKAVKRVLKIKRFEKVIDANGLIEPDQLVELMELRAFDLIEHAIEKQCIEEKSLRAIRIPKSGENDKKKKQLLYEKAQISIKKRNDFFHDQ